MRRSRRITDGLPHPYGAPSARETRGQPSFRWSPVWVLGPLTVLAVLVVLFIRTLHDLLPPAPSQAVTPSVERQSTPYTPRSSSMSVDDAARRLTSHHDLRSMDAARRLWFAGRKDDVFRALRADDTTERLATQILILVRGDRDPRVRLAAREILARLDTSARIDKLCNDILCEPARSPSPTPP